MQESEHKKIELVKNHIQCYSKSDLKSNASDLIFLFVKPAVCMNCQSYGQ
jgi:hypothetical protein